MMIFRARFSRSWMKRLLVLVPVMTLVGCSSGGMDDLYAEIEQIKQIPKGKIEPLPEFKPAEKFVYSAGGLGNPFVSWQVKFSQSQVKGEAKGDGLSPDLQRRREPLEEFPLDTLRMVGTLEGKGESSALVSSPDGFVTRVMVGNYLGQNHGKVIAVKADKIEIMEIVPDGLGGWQHRPASLALAE